MQAACAEASPAASPASNNGCKGHALVVRRRRHLPGKRQLLPETTYASGTKAPPCLDPQGLLVQGHRLALIRQANWYKGSALRATPCAGGSSYKQQCMQAACAEAPPAASPASTNGCKGHALVARRRPLLPAAMAASGTAAPASHHACKRHALRPRRRQHLPASVEAQVMRRTRASGSSCQQNLAASDLH